MELLEQLSAETNCLYLSDLKYLHDLSLLKQAISRINPEKYALNEWLDAIHYLTGEITSFSSPQEAKEYLVNAIKNQQH